MSRQANRAKWTKLLKFPERQNDAFFCLQGESGLCEEKYTLAWVGFFMQIVAAVVLIIISSIMRKPAKKPDDIRAQVDEASEGTI